MTIYYFIPPYKKGKTEKVPIQFTYFFRFRRTKKKPNLENVENFFHPCFPRYCVNICTT